MATILFVDDDIATLELMSKAVEVLGHRALLCSSSREVLNAVTFQNPDMILVDQQLHDGQGCEIIQALRQVPYLQDKPIYLVSAYASEKEKECARQAGANDCIEKPIGPQNLIDLLAKTNR
jgi:CheY-like chemotaxis protein